MSAPSEHEREPRSVGVAWLTLWCLTTAPSASAAALRSRCRLPPMADPRHAPSVFAAVHAAQWPSAEVRARNRVPPADPAAGEVFARTASVFAGSSPRQALRLRGEVRAYFATPAHALNTRAFRREGRNDETYRWSAYLAFLAAVARRRQIASALARRCSSWRELHAASLHATAYARGS